MNRIQVGSLDIDLKSPRQSSTRTATYRLYLGLNCRTETHKRSSGLGNLLTKHLGETRRDHFGLQNVGLRCLRNCRSRILILDFWKCTVALNQRSCEVHLPASFEFQSQAFVLASPAKQILFVAAKCRAVSARGIPSSHERTADACARYARRRRAPDFPTLMQTAGWPQTCHALYRVTV